MVILIHLYQNAPFTLRPIQKIPEKVTRAATVALWDHSGMLFSSGRGGDFLDEVRKLRELDNASLGGLGHFLQDFRARGLT